ncbi:MAG: MFS transporter, partial [Clostridium sp.]
KTNELKYEETNYTVNEMIKTKAFPLLWIVYLFGCVSGLLVIGLAKDIGVQLAGLTATAAANSIAIISIFNAGGRLIWATLSDKIGRIKVLFILFSLTSISMFSISFIDLNIYTFFIFLSIITFCFGGLLSVFPTIAGEFYGSKNVGANYGIIYQAYGLSALVGPIIITNTSGLKPTFIIAATLSLIASFITFTIKKPTKELCSREN